MSVDFHSLASDILLSQDNLVVDGDWLTEEEKEGLIIVTDQQWDEQALALAEYLEMASIEWINENVKSDDD